LIFNCGTSGNQTLALNNDSAFSKLFEKCTFVMGPGTGTSGSIRPNGGTSRTTCRDCTFKFANSSQWISIQGQVVIEGGSIDPTGSIPTQLFEPNTANGFVKVIGMDLSALASPTQLITGSNESIRYDFIDCKMPATFTLNQTTSTSDDSTVITASRCSGSAAPYQFEMWSNAGLLNAAIDVIRTGGAKDGAQSIAWKIGTTVNANLGNLIFEPPPIAQFNSVVGSNVTVTLFGLADSAAVPTNAEVFMFTEYLGASGNTLATRNSNRVADFIAAPSNHTADTTSAWDTGSVSARANSHVYVAGDVIKLASNPGRVFICQTGGTSNGSEPGGYATAVDGGSVTDNTAVFRAAFRFKMVVTLSSPQPQQAGNLYVRLFVAKPSTTYYLDPFVILT
jgi:hypothetical protein